MSKFYIYARGRWCEVDVSNGRVEGFRERARFFYLRGGRLHAARSAAVLRAARALAAGAPGAARDGPPLRQRRSRPRHRSRRSRPSVITHHCCAHVHAGSKGVPSELPPPATLVSPVLPSPREPEERKRRRISQSPPSAKTPLKRQKIEDSDSEDKQRTRQIQNKEKPLTPIKRAIHALIISSSDEQKQPVPRSLRNRTVNLELSSDPNPPRLLSPRKPHKRVTRQNVSNILDAKKKPIVVDESSNQQERSVKKQDKKRSPIVTDAKKLVELLLDSSSESSGSSRVQISQPRERCKELLISESDVNTLRRYLEKTGNGRAILSRFDHDERYKLRIFHRLNPLVTLERCKPLENLLLQKLTLKEFARNLGLRSVAEVTPEKRYKMRRSVRKASVTSDSEIDKENEEKPKKRKLWNNNKEIFSVRSSRSSELRPKIPKPTINRDSSKDTSDSDTEFKRRVREQLKNKPILKRRESFTEVRRRTRSTGRLSGEQQKPNQVESSVKPNPANRQTRLSGKLVNTFKAPQVPFSESETDKMKMKLARVSQNVETSEWVVVNKRAKAANPSRTLKEQNNDSGNEFQEKSPKKGNLVQKGKTEVKNSQNKQKDSRPLEKKSTEKQSQVISSMLAKPVKLKKSSVANGREYSSLEDHAIVAWVSVGGRERLVNGNRLWRELADGYQRLTGQGEWRRTLADAASGQSSLQDHALVAWVSVGGRERLVNGNRLWRELADGYQRLTGQGEWRRTLADAASGQSSLQDHALVAWVSVGGRERLVNGNRLWRELADGYQRLTGQGEWRRTLADAASGQSSLQDHALVAWVSVGGRERLVNGNRLWRELADGYQRLTGQGEWRRTLADAASGQSSLQDHALVAWVSVGGRERLVNGNRLWRELADGYQRLTGQGEWRRTLADAASGQSSLQDHALVAWVSVGGRERLVNGNRLWRELADGYQRLTGQGEWRRTLADAASGQSSLQDHALVAWVSVGGRERLVNGNRLWRELADGYQRLTGQGEWRRTLADAASGQSSLQDHALVAWVSVGGRERLVNGNRLWRELADGYQRLTGQGEWRRTLADAASGQSSLQDHALVAWVSVGGRERLVNGNRLWRELADGYQRLTGQVRSWHSLRNRYLRYVLPSLPALALPPAQVSRLRAAAAAGEIKLKSKASRRNSIFAAPAVRSASGRAPRAPAPAPAPARARATPDHAEIRGRRPPAPAPAPAPAPSPARLTRSAAELTHKHTTKKT